MVFQSVAFSSNRQNRWPPFEIVVQGLVEPGAWATRQPGGNGTVQLWEGSPFAIPKLQDCSVVAVDSCISWAEAGSARRHGSPVITNKSSRSERAWSMVHPSTELIAWVNCDSSSRGLGWGRYNSAMLKRLASCLAVMFMLSPIWCWAGDFVPLQVKVQATGGVKATATVLFPVEPWMIQQLLTNYAHWPELFDVRMRMAEIREQDGSVLTDIRLNHALLSGERRLLCESRSLPGGGLLTELKGGDFKQYRRVWTLTPTESGSQTKAEFELLVEIETFVPDWVIAVAMRQELETHFRIVREKALAQVTQGR